VGQEFIDALTTRVVKLTTSSWEESFGRLNLFMHRGAGMRGTIE
jgi:hypothetical protein